LQLKSDLFYSKIKHPLSSFLYLFCPDKICKFSKFFGN
jgi:hypothetical protein